MIVNIANVDRITVVETERYTPIPGDRYCPKATEGSLERMKSEAGKVHLIRPTAAVQYRKNITKFFNMRRGHPSWRLSQVCTLRSPTHIRRKNRFCESCPSLTAACSIRGQLSGNYTGVVAR